MIVKIKKKSYFKIKNNNYIKITYYYNKKLKKYKKRTKLL